MRVSRQRDDFRACSCAAAGRTLETINHSLIMRGRERTGMRPDHHHRGYQEPRQPNRLRPSCRGYGGRTPAGLNCAGEGSRQISWPPSPRPNLLHPASVLLAHAAGALNMSFEFGVQSRTTPNRNLPMDRRSRQDHRRRQTRAPSVRFDPLSCSPFQVSGTRMRCSRASSSEWPRPSRAGGTIIKTTVDHALMRGLDTAGPVMRRGASSV